MQNNSEVIHRMEWYKRINVFIFIKKLKRQFKDLKISLRIALFYFIVMIISLFISSLLYRQIYMNIAHQKVNEASVQTLYSIKTNVDLVKNIGYIYIDILDTKNKPDIKYYLFNDNNDMILSGNIIDDKIMLKIEDVQLWNQKLKLLKKKLELG